MTEANIINATLPHSDSGSENAVKLDYDYNDQNAYARND